jgi:hypothetical protein
VPHSEPVTVAQYCERHCDDVAHVASLASGPDCGWHAATAGSLLYHWAQVAVRRAVAHAAITSGVSAEPGARKSTLHDVVATRFRQVSTSPKFVAKYSGRQSANFWHVAAA